jgi:hypothetical protein
LFPIREASGPNDSKPNQARPNRTKENQEKPRKKSLDFLGFIRPNQDFSMGCGDSREKILVPLKNMSLT